MAPVLSRNWSDSVLLPWSIWAIMEKLRIWLFRDVALGGIRKPLSVGKCAGSVPRSRMWRQFSRWEISCIENVDGAQANHGDLNFHSMVASVSEPSIKNRIVWETVSPGFNKGRLSPGPYIMK